MSVHACSSGGRCNAQGAGHETPAARHYQRKPPHYQQLPTAPTELVQQHARSAARRSRAHGDEVSSRKVATWIFLTCKKYTISLNNIKSTVQYLPELDIASRAAFISGLHSSVLPLLLRFRQSEKIQPPVTPRAAPGVRCPCFSMTGS